MRQVSKKLGEILLDERKITEGQLAEALEYQKSNRQRLGHVLIKLNYISEDELLAVLTRQFGVPAIKIDRKMLNPAVAKILPLSTCLKYRLIPILRSGNTLVVAATDPFNLNFINEIKMTYPHDIELTLASENSILAAIEYVFGKIDENDLAKHANAHHHEDQPAAGSAVKGRSAMEEIEEVLKKGMTLRCKEIQLMHRNTRMIVFFLADKMVPEQKDISPAQYREIIHALKLMAKIPTDGEAGFREGLFTRPSGEREYFFRVHIFQTPLGDTAMMRIS
jgi:type IV pilus assembly protein PilB